ncbi:MAG: histidine phosphatase family protein [Candidatus Nanopelagicaceae bacterium]|nr:histidine phosphatase family protein [Candidatus Nanopelagicaceae bacterium]
MAKNRQRVVLWRHGQTNWNIENRFQGHSDIPLNEVGLQQAEHAAPLLLALRPNKIISSDLIRAQQTAAALSKIAQLQVAIDPGLRETNGGNWEGKTGAENRAEDYDRFVNWLDGDDQPAGQTGERRSEIANRAVNSIQAALSEDVSTLIVVTHGGTARCILGKMLEMPMNQWSAIGGLSNACWSILESGHHRNGWVLVEHNSGSLPEPIYGEESGA